MISHVAEVWLALFAAFAVGSILGWLIYRWIDRSDHAFDQREFTEGVGRRGRRQSALALPLPAAQAPSPRGPAPRRPEPALPRPGPARDTPQPPAVATPRITAQPNPPRLPPPRNPPEPARPPRGGGIEQLRAKIRANAGADLRPEPPHQRPDEASDVARRRLLARQGPPNPVPRAPADPQIRDPAGRDDAAWPARAEPWPIERPVAPSGGPAADGAGPREIGTGLFTQQPNHDAIWSQQPATVSNEPPESDPRDPLPPPRARGVVWGQYADADMSPDADMDFDAPAIGESTDAGAELQDVVPAEPEAARPPAVPRPERSDDFRKIKGIGPAFERQLNELGIYRYAQIASWTAAEQRWIGQHFGFAGRIERDDWVGQAAALMRLSEAATGADPVPGS